MDSYDKLQPYEIAINGCIDGFSHYVVWMEAYRTNNDPKVIADYFITSIVFQILRIINLVFQPFSHA